MGDLSGVLAELQKQRREAVAHVQRIDAAIVALGGTARRGRRSRRGRRPAATQGAASEAAPRGRRMSAAARKAVSERMKKYWAERRKAKK